MNIKNMSLSAKLFFVIAFGAAVMIIVGAVAIQNFNSVKGEWLSFLKVVKTKQDRLTSIRSQMGYGGAIHKFKNYVLRNRQKDHDKYMTKADEIKSSVAGYRSAGFLSPNETTSLEKVEEMVEAYRDATLKAKQLIGEGKTIKEIDSAIKINDNPSLDALSTLSKELDLATKARTEALSNRIGNVVITLMTLIPIAIILFVVSAFLISRSITRPINGIIDDLSEGSHQVSSASTQISSSSQNMASGATEQA